MRRGGKFMRRRPPPEQQLTKVKNQPKTKELERTFTSDPNRSMVDPTTAAGMGHSAMRCCPSLVSPHLLSTAPPTTPPQTPHTTARLNPPYLGLLVPPCTTRLDHIRIYIYIYIYIYIERERERKRTKERRNQ
jgi:hypothetical protein